MTDQARVKRWQRRWGRLAHLPAPARTTDNPAACGSNVVEDVETVIGDALGDRPENSARLFSSPHHRRAHSVPVMSRRTGLRAVVVLAVAMAIVWPPVVGGPDSAVGQARAAVVAQVLHDAAAAHDEAVRADLSGDVEKAARLYRRALEVRPEQWESSLRLGTLNLRLQRTAEAESALRYTIALAEQHQRVDLCAARTNLGVLLFSASSSAAPNKQRQATGWAAEALTQYEAAASAGTCNIARLNAARLLADIAERDPPLPRDVPGVGQLSDSQEQLKTAAAVHYGAALAVAIEQDDTATADASARAYALLRPGGGEGAAGKPLPQPLSTEQHVAVGRAALVLGDREGARYHTAAAFTLNPKSHAVYTNIALMAEQRGVVPESVTAYRKAIDLARASAAETPNTGAAAASIRAAAASSNNLGNILQGVGRLREALDAYDATLELRPENAEAWNNRGVALYAEGQYDEAVQSYSHALELLPNFVQAFGGMMYVKTYTCDWQNRNADLALLQGHAARWLSGEGPQVLLPLQALVYPLPSHLLRAITELHANQLRAVHANRLLSSKSSQGAGAGSKAGAASVPAPGPIEAEMDLMDDAALEARTYREEDKEARGGRGERLRLCYCSIGFGAHPHGQLIRGVIAAHDREKVEVVVLAFSDDDGSVERHDIAHSADHFVPLHAHSDPATAMAQWDCDVALYLDGYLLGARPELFYRTADQDETEEAAEAAAAFAVAAASSSADLAAAAAAAAAWQTRLGLGSPEGVEPEDEQAQEQGSFGDTLTAGSAGAHAPPNRKGGGVGGVQISLLYPGTLGSADFDYHVGDRIATPLELHATQFTEVALIMPYSCFPTDYTRSYAAKPYTGSAPPVVPWLVDSSAALLGPLPPTSFRFVNFNQLFKVDPRTATGWGNVLRRTPGATLWQLSTPAAGAKRLKAEFRALGVHGKRLWFSQRTTLSEHLGRISSMSQPWSSGKAGLGLDTRQYNSRSTGTDMLWGGLPFLTVAGASLASRVGASLAVAHGVPDLLTFSEKEYEDLAVSYSGGGSGGPADTVVLTTTDKATGQEKILHVPASGFGPGMGAATMRYLGDRQKQIGRWRAGSAEQYEWVQAQAQGGRAHPRGGSSGDEGVGRRSRQGRQQQEKGQAKLESEGEESLADKRPATGKLFDSKGWVEDFERRLGQAWQRYLVGRPLRDLGESDDWDDGL